MIKVGTGELTPDQALRMQLRVGDVLLYAARGIFGLFIRLKTWHPIAHVECYVGMGSSVASRDGIGVGRYPLRTDGLKVVCRPRRAFDPPKAMAWFTTQKGAPYGWADLLAFVGMKSDGKGVVCSPFVTDFLRAGGIDPFNGEPSRLIAPFQFELSNLFTVYEVTNGTLVRRDRKISASAS